MDASLAASLILLLQFAYEGHATTLPGAVQPLNPTTPPTPIGIKLTSSTDVIEPTLTRDLYIMCSFPKPTDLGLDTIMSLVVSKSKGGNSTEFQDIASVNSARPLEVKVYANVGAKISGKLDTQGLTFIRLDWTFPSEYTTGVYVCEANSLNMQGHPISVRTSIKITSKSPDMQDLLNQLREFTKQQEAKDREFLGQLQRQNVTITHLKDQLRKQNCTVDTTSILDRLHVLELFDISAVAPAVTDKQYLVSRIGNVNISTAQALCNVAGGHLADIRNSAELDVVKTFMKTLASTAQFYSAYFSPTQENNPGRWVYRHSGEDMNFTQIWRSGYPDKTPREDCALLGHDHWTAYNDKCEGFSNANFICERSVAP